MARISFEQFYENVLYTLWLMSDHYGVTKKQIERALSVSERTAERYLKFIRKHFLVTPLMSVGQTHYRWERRAQDPIRYAVLSEAKRRGETVPSDVHWIDW